MKLYLEDNKIEKCINYKCKSKKNLNKDVQI